ncbi:MAG: FAD-dependent oxidoreductase [Pseudoxanthomonas sp.]
MSDVSKTADVTIVGAGQAGSEVATSLRQQGFTGSIVLLGDEPYLPYRRPPLSKTYLAGEASQESLYIKAASAYEKHGIQCRTGIAVEKIDRESRRLFLSDGTTLTYGTLVLATGGRPRKLTITGAEHDNVYYVRTLDDIERLKRDFRSDARLVVIGGGYIGLEAAAVAVKHGLRVSVVEAAPRVLARVAAPELSSFYERVHREHGVELLTGRGVSELLGQDRVDAVLLDDGKELPADLVVVGVGLIPNVELAAIAGLEVDNGIVVDAETRTSDPSIYAAGDCTSHHNDFYGKWHRLESVPNAIEQGRIVASNITGKPARYSAVPWFWSDQYDLKLQMVGLSAGYDQIVVRGSFDSNSFIAFYVKDGVVISADAVNRPHDFMIAKQLVADRVHAPDTSLADETQPLKALLGAS